MLKSEEERWGERYENIAAAIFSTFSIAHDRLAYLWDWPLWHLWAVLDRVNLSLDLTTGNLSLSSCHRTWVTRLERCSELLDLVVLEAKLAGQRCYEPIESCSDALAESRGDRCFLDLGETVSNLPLRWSLAHDGKSCLAPIGGRLVSFNNDAENNEKLEADSLQEP